ncbi:unnamed protein product [Protopolystoma xenopodis]|uniref:Uncharacterized protein n=1 Tax=Protopolystoma xenopodis TaxID=117903 RepID=A0A448WHR5_9PLAT|nr:unnamed protein product [Protopolystoma xenopodis]
MTGNCVSLCLGIVLPVIITFITTRNWDEKMQNPDVYWDAARDIDNPLKPWPELYAEELRLINPERLDDGRPCLYDVKRAFRGTMHAAVFISVVLTFVFVVLWPSIACGLGVMNYEEFLAWTLIMEIWLICATMAAFFVPLISELYRMRKAILKNRINKLLDKHESGKSEEIE